MKCFNSTRVWPSRVMIQVCFSFLCIFRMMCRANIITGCIYMREYEKKRKRIVYIYINAVTSFSLLLLCIINSKVYALLLSE